MASKVKSRAQLSGRDRNFFTIYIKLEPTDEVFPLKKVYPEMKISELKDYTEFATGVPINLQRISYLDEGDLLDHTDIRSNDIVPGATLLLRVWTQWRDLIEAVGLNDEEWVFKLGVTTAADYKTPNSEYMTKRARKAWFEERAFVALCIAAHRGHTALCKKLINTGADVNAVSPLGRSALHVAAAQGHGHIVDILLENGADIDAEDDEGYSALTIADKFGHKSCERHLFLFRWQERAKKTRPSHRVPMMAHQFHDSKFPVWLKGQQAQLYFTNILPPDEFEGSALNAPKRSPHPGALRRKGFHDLMVRIQVTDFDEDIGSAEQVSVKKDKSKGYGFFTHGKGQRGDMDMMQKRPPTHDEWLAKIKSRENKDLEKKRKEREKKKEELEEKKKRSAGTGINI